jgi:phage terminase large subunit
MLERCPRCGSPWTTTTAINGGPSEFWKECSNPSCNTYFNTYVPQAHQFAFHEDSHTFTGNFGGYGSGKTLTSREEIFKHLFITPNGNTLIGANVASQYEQTIKREIEADLPAAFVRRVNTQKAYIDFINGHRIMYRPYDDPEKLRSYNLTCFLIVEASEVKQQSFVQLKTRLRNLAATVPKVDGNGDIVYKIAANGVKIPVLDHNWQKGIIESNPSAGWIKNDVLTVSSNIYKHGDIVDEYDVDPDKADPAISTHVTSTSANEFLPENFIDNNVKNKPLWWVNRYIYGSFLYAEGKVYPKSNACICDDFEIPKHWKRIVAFDYGLADDAVFIAGAVDMDKGILYIYDECRSNDNNIETLSNLFFEFTRDIPIGGWICPPIIDPKSGPKRDYDKKSLSDHFLDYGISFIPGFVNVDARIFRLNTYFESGKIRIFRRCKGLIEELDNYKFKADESLASGYTGKPVDKDNHGINALEWITMELPANPADLLYGVYGKNGVDLSKEKEKEAKKLANWALSDEEDSYIPMSETPFDMVDYNMWS